MNDTFPEVDALVSEIRNNANFLYRMFFPRISLIIGIGIGLIVIAVRLLH